jgi:uncharacterized protein YycO
MRLILVLISCLSLEGAAQPKIDFGNTRIEVGIIPAGPEYKLTWHFSNSGNEPLVIADIRSSGSILFVKSYEQKPIKPGERSQIDAVLDTRNWADNRFNKSLLVKTNAGKEILLSATGFISAADGTARLNIRDSFSNLDMPAVAPNGNDVYYNVQPGDILFQDLDCGHACDAIEKVTEGVDGMDFSHCGIVVQMGNDMMVVEAYGAVKATAINDFMARSKDPNGDPKVVIGRLKDEQSSLADESAEIAKEYIGKGYDDAFNLDNDKYYCSELVYECFKKANKNKPFFQLNKMTFKEPGTNTIMPFWVDYFKKLNAAIPEGKRGINPGAMSRNEQLIIIKPKPL